MRTDKEHFDWCKERAQDYINMGDAQGAFSSFTSDMNKHEGTKNRIDPFIMCIGMMDTPRGVVAVKRWIDGFPSP